MKFEYVSYIEATPEQVWRALTDADLSAEYWGHRNVSDWQPGSRWEHQRKDDAHTADVVGTVLESVPPFRLLATSSSPDETRPDGPTREQSQRAIDPPPGPTSRQRHPDPTPTHSRERIVTGS